MFMCTNVHDAWNVQRLYIFAQSSSMVETCIKRKNIEYLLGYMIVILKY